MESSAVDAANSKLDECTVSLRAAYNSRIHELEEQLRQKDAELSRKDATIRERDDDVVELQRQLQACMEQQRTARMGTDIVQKPSNGDPRIKHKNAVKRQFGQQASASKKQRLDEPSRHHPFVPGEVWIDVFSTLSRFQLDAVGFTCPRFRRIVYDSTSSVCLRPFDSVTFKSPIPDRALKEKKVELVTAAAAPLGCSRTDGVHPLRAVCVISFAYMKTVPPCARPSGKGQKTADRVSNALKLSQHEEFYSHSAAYEYARQLLRSASVAVLTVDKVHIHPEFFTFFDQVAPTISIGHLILRPKRSCILPVYFHSFLRLLAVDNILVTDIHARPNHLTDDFLVRLAAKRLTCLTLSPGSGGTMLHGHFNVTDDGILAFLFRESDEIVTFDVDKLPISNRFSNRLLQRAQQATSNAPIYLQIRRGVDTALQDSQLVSDFGHYRRERRRQISYKLPVTGGMPIRLRLFRPGGRLEFQSVPVDERRELPYAESSDSSSSS